MTASVSAALEVPSLSSAYLGDMRECQAKSHPSRRCNSYPRQGPASQRESSLALCEATTTAKRRQSDQQATTKVKRIGLVTDLAQRPTGSSSGKAPVDAGYGDCVGDAAGVEARGTLGKGWMQELGKPTVVSASE
jgi:hypothetical protein